MVYGYKITCPVTTSIGIEQTENDVRSSLAKLLSVTLAFHQLYNIGNIVAKTPLHFNEHHTTMLFEENTLKSELNKRAKCIVE